jgi:hypothetical protein
MTDEEGFPDQEGALEGGILIMVFIKCFLQLN